MAANAPRHAAADYARAGVRLLRGFWRWARGGYHGGHHGGYHRSYPRGHASPRGWLWPVARLIGLLPVSFKECVCALETASTPPHGSDRASGTTAPMWELGRGGAGKDCSCPVAVHSLPWTLYSFAVAAVLLPCSVLAPYSDRENALAGRPSLRMSTKPDEIVTFCDILSVSACSTICFLQAAFSQASLFALLDQLQQVDRLLMTRPPAVPGLLALWMALLATVMVMDGSMWTQMNQGLGYAATYFPFYGLYINLFVMEVLFIDEAHSIHMRFLALNEKLEATLALPSYQAATEQPPMMPLDGGWLGSSPRSNALSISGLTDGTLYSSKTSNGGGRRSRPPRATVPLPGAAGGLAVHPAVAIQRLNMAHHLLCDSTLSVGRRYGLSLLGDMLCLLLHLVITAYFFLKYLFVAKLNAQTQTVTVTSQYILMQAVWLAVHLGRMFMLVLPCSRASAEASRTGALVGVVLSTSAPTTVVHKQLETFSIQLLHHRVNFNACGLFELGLPLVVSILGAVTTYLVVLLQIKASPPDGVPANATVVT